MVRLVAQLQIRQQIARRLELLFRRHVGGRHVADGAGRRRGVDRDGHALGIAIHAVEHQALVAIARDRFDERLHLRLGTLQRLQVGHHLRRHFLAVLLAELFQPGFLFLDFHFLQPLGHGAVGSRPLLRGPQWPGHTIQTNTRTPGVDDGMIELVRPSRLRGADLSRRQEHDGRQLITSQDRKCRRKYISEPVIKRQASGALGKRSASLQFIHGLGQR